MAFTILRSLGLGRPLLGLDIGSAAVKVVQLVRGRKGPVLQYAGLAELLHAEEEGEDRGVAMALNQICRTGKLKRMKMAMAYGGGGLNVRYLTIPRMPKDEIGEAVRWEAKKQVPQLNEDSVVDFLVVGETEERDLKRYEIVLVVADRRSIIGQLEELKGYRPLVAEMDVNALALLNAVKLNYPEDFHSNLVFVDIGAVKMDINIAKDGVLRFYRRYQIGGRDVTTAIARCQNIDFQEAEQLKRERGLTRENGAGEDHAVLEVMIRDQVDRMILEIQRSIDYYRAQFREGGIRKVILMGGAPLMPGFREYVAPYFDSEVVLDNPFARFAPGKGQTDDLMRMAPRFSTSAGLALRTAGG